MTTSDFSDEPRERAPAEGLPDVYIAMGETAENVAEYTGTTREEMLAAVLKSMNRVLAGTLRQASEVVELKPVVKLTGGMSDAHYLALKKREMPGFDFEVVDNCPILGNVWLARRGLGLV